MKLSRENTPKNISHSLNWRCVHKETCGASLTISIYGNLVLFYKEHTVPDDAIHGVITEVEREVNQCIKTTKRRVLQEDKSANKIWQEKKQISRKTLKLATRKLESTCTFLLEILYSFLFD
jgi:hypothetical protein